MTQDSCRSVGALIGLAIGLGLMVAMGMGGVLPGFLFGAGGAVAGGISGETIYAWRRSSDS